MEINWTLIALVVFVAVMLIGFFIRKNRKDRKDFEDTFNRSVLEPEEPPRTNSDFRFHEIITHLLRFIYISSDWFACKHRIDRGKDCLKNSGTLGSLLISG